MANTRNSRPPADLAERASNRLRKFAGPGDRLIVALSGGIDSVVLLHVLHHLQSERGFLLSALHVNHGISTNADSWQVFCEALCREWGIALDVRKAELEHEGTQGLEAAARHARYKAFAFADAEWLVLAHHRDDQAETLLFNLLRGAGAGGAAAMPVQRTLPGRSGLGILRPLLDVSRSEIVSYACAENLKWIDDESNADLRYSRNFIRHRVIPLLRERFPGCEAVLGRAASHFSECENLLENLARIDAGSVIRGERIVAAELARLEDSRARNLMRYVLKAEGILMPDRTHLNEIVRQICQAGPDRHLSFDLGDRKLHRYRGEVWLVPREQAREEREWRGEVTLAWGGARLHFSLVAGTGINRDKLAGRNVRIATRRGGECFRPDPRRPRRELRKLLQERHVPPWERDGMPLLWCDDELVWVPGIGIDCDWQCEPMDAGLLPNWDRGG